jgi:ABC-type ATPase involved in cell division
MNPLLTFQHVTLEAGAPYDAGLRDVSLALAPGELALVRLPYGTTVTPLADLACGVIDPEQGEVAFQGESWNGQGADREATRRGLIGRVFERAGWLSNLDVDENITLARRYHERWEPAEALRQAQDLALRLGMSGVPAGRPALVPRGELLRAQWVRALLGEPVLLLLERPVRDLPPAWVAPLVTEVQRRRAAGVAVLWLTDDHERLDPAALTPTLKFGLEDGNIHPQA